MDGYQDPRTGYTLTELLPIVQKLTDKYTSKESSSITYEMARQLMDAVIYCICEGLSHEKNSLSTYTTVPVSKIYEDGYQRVLEKTKDAKELYHHLIETYDDYGCRNYGDTIKKGMPAFFLKYDAMFAPQDHILTLDYPLSEDDRQGSEKLCGIDLILYYLQCISKEQRFLARFEPEAIREMLKKIQPEYEELYLDNICDPIMDGLIS